MHPSTPKPIDPRYKRIREACSIIAPSTIYFEPPQDITLSEVRKVRSIFINQIQQHGLKIAIVKASKTAWEAPIMRERIRSDLEILRNELTTIVLLGETPIQKIQSQFFAQPLKEKTTLLFAETLEEALNLTKKND